MINVSICVPTYNRARMLRQCLDHLAEFQDQNFELVIGDNASTDDTAEVVASYRSRFRHLVYLRHDENLGFARNMDSVLRRASRPYMYILNDDDLVFEGALSLASTVFSAHPEVVAIVGQYLSVRSVEPDLRMDFADAVATTFPKGSHLALLNNIVVCDGHPILRRETFERHGAYLDRTGVLTPLYFSLLSHGDLIVVDKPFFQHRTSRDSLTGRMVEGWFLDMSTADLELAVSDCFNGLPPEVLPAIRRYVFQILYFQAVRMAVNQQNVYLVWLFLRRLMAMGGTADGLLLKCEYHFSHEFVTNRIAAILGDAGFETLHYQDSPLVRAALTDIARLRPGTRLIAVGPDAEPDGIELLLADERPTAPLAPRVIALDDLFGQFRLTPHAARLAPGIGRLIVEYRDAATVALLLEPTPTFDSIRAPYSEDIQPEATPS